MIHRTRPKLRIEYSDADPEEGNFVGINSAPVSFLFQPQAIGQALGLCRPRWIVVSLRIAPIFSDTSRTLDICLSVDNFRYSIIAPPVRCLHVHPRNIFRSFLQAACL